jgi:hypothetical protein
MWWHTLLISWILAVVRLEIGVSVDASGASQTNDRQLLASLKGR